MPRGREGGRERASPLGLSMPPSLLLFAMLHFYAWYCFLHHPQSTKSLLLSSLLEVVVGVFVAAFNITSHYLFLFAVAIII